MKLFTTTLLLVFSIGMMAQTTWFEIPTNTTKKLNTISFGSSQVGYIGGNDNLLLKTTDGGQTWSEVAVNGVDFPQPETPITDLQFVDETTGFMGAGSFGGVYKTTDGGSNWTELPVVMCFGKSLFFWDEQNGYVGGAGCFQGEQIDIYSDGDFTPATINTPSWDPADGVVDIDFLDQNFGMAVSRSRFLRTIDGGLTWDTIPTIDPDPLTSIEIVNDTLVFAGYTDEESAGYGLHVSHDGGLTWTSESEMATFAYPDYNDVMTTANGYIYSASGSYFNTTGAIFENKGEGWLTYEAAQSLFALDSYGDSTVFAVGDSGLVITNVNPLLSIDEAAVNKNDLVIYPNPAVDLLTYKLRNENNPKFTRVAIRNTLGQLVLTDTPLDAQIDVSSLSQGSYILEIETENRKYSRLFLKK